ncbi:MAG: peptide/nickel transport system permease protein [Myxococcota bacterium]|jgi:peptide/nickel transport system permease protein
MGAAFHPLGDSLQWWVRPLVRAVAAVVLPLLVPAIIIAIMWALPGNPAELICPNCEGTVELAARWNLDKGPVNFYMKWLGNAFTLDFGKSWRTYQGMQVSSLLWEKGPWTAALVLLAAIPLFLGTISTALGWLPKRLDVVWQVVGIAPSVILALICTAYVTITWGAMSTEGPIALVRLFLGALVLGVADGALSGAVNGTRQVMEEEVKQRYVGVAILRGERVLANALPNVIPALIGQFRGRLLLILSSAVIVEVVLQIDGLGSLLWSGTLMQDFGVVLAAVWVITVISCAMLLAQAVSEVIVERSIRHSPAVPA